MPVYVQITNESVNGVYYNDSAMVALNHTANISYILQGKSVV